ncbi:MAG: sigma-70 family RNA polymerase sigma factor [Planctomycetia bacterium]|nr:MAG: sigma-70 family RNA polymerase sigma factor [Planctomycetia bacterium]
MPANRYQSACLADLAAQLRHSPVRLRLRQLLGVEFLLSVVESSRAYPEDFVVHGITGYRPRLAAGLEPRLIEADALRADLVQLAEDLSEAADLSADDWPEAVWTVADLAERFDVSTKTIFRWRRRGLVGWKFRGADRRQRLAFPDRCVRQFVARNAGLVHRGSSFSQLSESERDTIVARARELVTQGQRTVNAVARVISAETGRAVETIRLLLKNFDTAQPTVGLFNRPAGCESADDVSLSVWEAHLDGTSVASLAERFDLSAARVRDILLRMRARELKARKIEFFHVPEFDAVDVRASVLEAPAALEPYQASGPSARRAPADLPPYLQQLFQLRLLSPEGELALFRKLNCLRYMADRARAAIDEESPTVESLDAVESLLAQADEVKNQIVQANLRLVVSIAKRHSSPLTDFFETVSDGNISLMRAVDKFDFTRGFKFSTYGSWAIIRNFARTIPEQRYRRERYQTGREELLESTASLPLDEAENESVPAIRSLLERMMGTLDDREREILRHRFGLEGGGQPQTLEQIGRRFGVSKERVRQLEARAMQRLRTDYSDEARRLMNA